MLPILIIIPFFGCVFSQDFVQESNVIQVEEYTNLICVLNSTNYADVFKKNYFKWLKIDKYNNYYFIIDLENNTIFNNNYFKKISTFIIDDKFILQIKNITEDNKKNNYDCYYKNDKSQKYENKFKLLTNLTFFNPFSLENMKIEYINSTQININFEKIFPIPKCFVKINNESFFPENNIQNKTLDYLYSQVNLSMKISCSNEIKIICTLLNKNFTINSKNNTCIYNNSIIKISTIIILSLISGIILIIFIHFKRKEPSERKKILYTLINKKQ